MLPMLTKLTLRVKAERDVTVTPDLAAAGSMLTAALVQASHSQPLIVLSFSFPSKTAGIRRSSYQIIVCFLVSVSPTVRALLVVKGNRTNTPEMFLSLSKSKHLGTRS